MRCPTCGSLVQAPAVPATARVDLARLFGSARAQMGIYRNADDARAAFSALYGNQNALCEAAMSGWEGS